MPDRYGEDDQPDAQVLRFTPRQDTTLHKIALTIGCRYCHATAGQPCRNQTLDDHPPTRIPHASRITDSQEVPF